MDSFLLAVTIILAIMLIFMNFYLLVLYCHRNHYYVIEADDNDLGASLICKILVVNIIGDSTR